MAVTIEGMRTLVVEDCLHIAMMMCDMLDEAGCTVIGPASRLEQAQRLADQHELDMALLDIDLDGECSYPLALALRTRGVPVVLLTGFDGCSIPPELAGVPVLEKPVDVERLRRTLARMRG